MAIAKSNSILCLQEHWLNEYENNTFVNLLPQFTTYARYKEISDESLFQRRSGRGGVAILWPNTWTGVKKLKEGNERIIGIEIQTQPMPTCIINCYMPTRNTDSNYKYLESLDSLHNFISSYSDTHNILICGDMNGTLQDSRNNVHDKMLKQFVIEHNLDNLLASQQDHTFHSHSGIGSSQIDYFLARLHMETKIANKYTFQPGEIMECNPTNYSSHVPIYMSMNLVQQPATTKTKQNSRERVIWNEADSAKFQEIFRQSMCSTIQDDSDIKISAQKYTECIHASLMAATHVAVPTKKVMINGPRWKASPTMMELMKTSRIAHAVWRDHGKPTEQHILYRQMKSSKKQCRQQLRREQAQNRDRFYTEVMENVSNDMFHKLIRRNKKPAKTETCSFMINDRPITDIDDQRTKLASYYEDLAMPKRSSGFDDESLKNDEANLEIILNICRHTDEFLDFTTDEVQCAISLLNTGKSPDEYGLSAEHFKMAGNAVLPAITKLFNTCIREGSLPSQFRTGVITPIPKKDKDHSLLDNYRGITVTAVIGKIFEYTVLHRIEKMISATQSNMQFGFTKGLSPIMAALLVSEIQIDAKENDKPLYLVFRDVKKAFDVVNHDILFNKLYHLGIDLNILNILIDMYRNLEAKVRWKGTLSDSFHVGQGVRQGGILSTHLYKCYIGEFIMQMEDMGLGYKVGSTYAGCVTCADDMVLATDNSYDLQVMLNASKNDADRHRFVIHPDKTVLVKKMAAAHRNQELLTRWSLGDSGLTEQKQTTHLGVIRSQLKENELNIQKRISDSRRTLFALIPSGMHGSNGLNPKVSFRIYQAHVIPRLLYGTEILPLTEHQINELEKFHIKTIRSIQSLPQRTPKCISYLLVGAYPIVAEYHKRQLSLLGSILLCENKCMHEIMLRQSAICEHPGSYFVRMRDILSMYNLPPLSSLMNKTLTKYSWKRQVKIALAEKWTSTLKSECASKSTLGNCHIDTLSTGKTHPVWDTVASCIKDVRKGVVKARLLTGTYMTQTLKSKYSSDKISPTCPLCNGEDEDLHHILFRCEHLWSARFPILDELLEEVSPHFEPGEWHRLSKESQLQLIVDSQLLVTSGHLPDDSELLQRVEVKSRQLVYNVHCRRMMLLSQSRLPRS